MKYFLIALVLCAASVSRAQEIEANVVIDARQLRSEDRATFASFAQQAQEYVNSFRWTSEEWTRPKVHMSIQVSITQSNGDGTYQGQILVMSQRSVNGTDQLSAILRVLDQSWQFAYSRGLPLIHVPMVFNSVASMFDFYAYAALGCEADSRADLGGTDLFRHAYDICAQAQSSTASAGWGEATSGYSRMSYVGELLAPRFEQLRHLMYSYSGAQDLMASNPDGALAVMRGVVDSLVLFKNAINGPCISLDRVLDAKYLEFSATFADAPDKGTIFQELETIDPSHQSFYEDARNK